MAAALAGASAAAGGPAATASVRRTGVLGMSSGEVWLFSRGRDRGAIDLQLDQNVVRPPDHNQVFDVVAPDEHQLALPVEAEGVDQPEPRLAGPSAGNTQTMSESQPVQNRQNDEDGDPAGQKEADLQDPIVRERKITQPLHAQSKTSAPECDEAHFKFARQRRFGPRQRRKVNRPGKPNRGAAHA